MLKKFIGAAAALVLAAKWGITAFALGTQDVSAKAAVVYQPQSGQVLFDKNMNDRLPMASTTKIMTTLLMIENGGLDEEFVVDPYAIRVEGSSMGLVEGDIVTGRALCAGMLLPSGNDAAGASAVRVAGSYEKFAELMNFRAGLIGMRNTHFVTPSGLHDDDHYSTAYDMALLAAEALEEPEFAEICKQSSLKVRFGNPPYDRYLKNTNKLLTMYEGCIGVKTGFTDEAGRCLVSACERDGIELICVTLNDRNDWQDHIAMYNDAYSMLSPVEVDVGEIYENVAGSVTETIKLKCSEKIIYPAANGELPEIKCSVICPPFVYAPVKEGDVIGKVRVTADGRVFGEYDLTAAESAEYCYDEPEGKNSFWDKLTELFE